MGRVFVSQCVVVYVVAVFEMDSVTVWTAIVDDGVSVDVTGLEVILTTSERRS